MFGGGEQSQGTIHFASAVGDSISFVGHNRGNRRRRCASHSCELLQSLCGWVGEPRRWNRVSELYAKTQRLEGHLLKVNPVPTLAIVQPM